jgi:hypothetical protein
MHPLATIFASPGPVFGSIGMDMLFILWITGRVIVLAAIPLLAGMHKGHVGLGILAALITIPFSIAPSYMPIGILAVLGLVGALILSMGLSILIQFIPKFEKPLLSQAEIEAETRRMRGY